MNMMAERFTLSGTAVPVDAARMLEDICRHFVEYSEIRREADGAVVENHVGSTDIRVDGGKLAIRLSCPTARLLNAARNMVAEHLFQFAGEEPLELVWADAPKAMPLAEFRMITVVSARNITPHMRRVTVACDDAKHYLQPGCGLHVRLLIPPKGRQPIWPMTRPDGRIDWPKGEDELCVRIYTIRSVNLERGQMDIDFVLHDDEGKPMPGAAFAANAQAGDVAGLLGPGGGSVPDAADMILAGDETALPAIARMAASVPAGTRVRAFIEVDGPSEEQVLPSAGDFELTWLHRNGAKAGTSDVIEKIVRAKAETCGSDTFIFVGCERSQAKTIRDFLKARGHDRHKMSVGAYWQRQDDSVETA